MRLTNNRQSKIEKAFTLIELLVVIAIIGILAGMVVVNMSGATESARIAKVKVFSNSIQDSLLMNRVSEWNFDEASGTSALDTWGSNPGTFTSAPARKSGSDCVSGGCLSFDGTDDYVDVGKLGNFGSNLNVFSVTVWVKTADTRTLRSIMKQINNGGSDVFGIEPNRGTLSPGCNLDDSAIGQTLFYVRDNAGLSFARHIAYNIYDGSWHHIAWNMINSSSNSMQIYVDGRGQTLYGSCSQSPSSFIDFNQSVYIGAANNRGTPGGHLNGSIDEVRIYSAPLASSAVREQYAAGLDKLLANGQITQQDYQQRLVDLNSTYATNE